MNVCILRYRAACLLILSLSLMGTASPTTRNSPPSWFWGCWKITKLLEVADTSALSPTQAKAIIGKRLVFSRACARSGRTVIHTPKYSVKVLSKREFFEGGYYVPLSQIGIHQPFVTVVEIELPANLSDLNFPGNNIYLREKDIVIEVEGDYFIAEKANLGDPACKCEEAKPE